MYKYKAYFKVMRNGKESLQLAIVFHANLLHWWEELESLLPAHGTKHIIIIIMIIMIINVHQHKYITGSINVIKLPPQVYNCHKLLE